MNSMQIKDKLRNIGKKKNVDFNILLRLYMYDRFIERLSVSKYKDNFILKGGFYLSTLFGVENRTTKDIDTAIKDAEFTRENIEKMINDIIFTDINDDSIIELVGISTIREEDEYGGYRIFLEIIVENMREKISIDIATGDPITPYPYEYQYIPILGDKIINVWVYSIETVIAEKLETILKRAEANSRIRDFYDLYLIYIKGWDNVRKKELRKAVEKTFDKRKYTGDIIETLEVLKNSDIIRNRWNLYSSKYDYAKNISYDEIMECINEVIGVIINIPV